MKKYVLILKMLIAVVAAASAQTADDIKGVWMSADKDAKIEIYKSGNLYSGRIIWGKDIYEQDGKTPRTDIKNSNTALRTRSMLNLVILSGFSYADGEWSGGELYDPKTGKTYKSKMKLKQNSLEIRGYVGSPMFGKTTVWTRVS